MIKSRVKTYGVDSGYNKGRLRYFCVCDGRKTSLHYARKESAMKNAERFCRSCYVDFTMPNGTEVKFEFKQVKGLNNE